MSRIATLFETKKKNVLNMYCTAGFPALESTLPVMQALQKNGADIIELGIPYSDPLADGPVIQKSNTQAIANGMTIATLFAQLQNMRQQISIPVILMGNFNPVFQYGFEKFCFMAKQVGVDGIILPDLPMHEFQTNYESIFKQHGLDFIFLITPETSDERIAQVDRLSSGFVYAVSSSSTTGGEGKSQDALKVYFEKLKNAQLNNPILIGFNIKDRSSFQYACQYANGAIIGTAYINALATAGGDVETATEEFMKGVL
jgi:tryptophan synthase alpha chain